MIVDDAWRTSGHGRRRRGLRARVAAGARNPGLCRVLVTKVQNVGAGSTVEHRGQKYPAYLVLVQSPDAIARLLVDAEYFPMMVGLEGAFYYEWTDESPATFRSSGWVVSKTVPIEGEPPEPDALGTLTVSATFSTPILGGTGPFEDNRYHSVQRRGDAIRLNLRATGGTSEDGASLPLPFEVRDAEAARYLAATSESQSDHPTIVAKAREIVKGAANARDAATGIMHWVHREIRKRSGARETASALQALESGVGTCREHAMLTVALCRAVGIPARSVSGILLGLDSDGRLAAGYHVWSEVYLGRWIGVDAAVPEFGTSARYIFLLIEEPTERERALGKIVQAMGGGLRLRVEPPAPEPSQEDER